MLLFHDVYPGRFLVTWPQYIIIFSTLVLLFPIWLLIERKKCSSIFEHARAATVESGNKFADARARLAHILKPTLLVHERF